MSVTTAPAKHTAAGQYLGYALQPVRLCYHLLSCEDGAFVSLEHVDDVAIHTVAGNVVREQMKSALTQNPLSDWSVDLWKTISIWMESVATGETDVETTRFRYYVTPIKGGNFAEALNKASTAEEVAAVTTLIRKALGRKRPACFPYLQTFLDATDSERASVISRMMIVSTDNDPLEPLRDKLRLFLPAELLDDTCGYLIGMAKEEGDGLIRRRSPALISSEVFRRKTQALIRKVNLPLALTSFVPTPPSSVVHDTLSARPTFIRQLELIEAKPDECLRAVSDFLRASADKSSWAEKGMIFEESLDELDSNLKMHHSAISGEVSDLHSDKSSEMQGRLVYRRCVKIELPLEGRTVPGHFVHGCLNSLADNLHLGWHPDYADLLDKDS